ncbi:hypothetical protein CAPTEDRAFT_206881 [Capitella teleta]|uniref:Uncharacterized protein n=1 Tax=Capitella teleta TaxID=283909 RepID=R7UPC1_CAPTE|nr:hypothetical protein CAPTEDRAFT_206881 [Capitella teleta]|eukprot:ELU05251.1 hypothetical protein CAPTEDRAFT_206881 [Capitella teleta]
MEAHVDDIVQALLRISERDVKPVIAVDACEIPSLPSLTGEDGDMRMRVSYLEDTCRELGRTVQQPSDVIQHRLHRLEPTYCSQPSSVKPTYSQSLRVSRPDQATGVMIVNYNCNSSSLTLPKTISTDSTHDPLPDGESYTRNMSARHNEHAPSTCVPQQKSVIVPSAAPIDCDGFTVPSHVLNKRRKQARRKRKTITGSNTGDQTLKGATQDANRDLFVYHVDKSATTEDLEHLMTSQKCEVRKRNQTIVKRRKLSLLTLNEGDFPDTKLVHDKIGDNSTMH